ncbi:HD domain-containing protein, partial [Candidatus Azambacteria bacterium]|nr:HD domain-containing protein [Candidatus Azambacteria bacterium]
MFTIPDVIQSILEKLIKAGFEAYIVGGCVRDLLLKKEPKDWDITTSAQPEEILALFPDSFYENKFGTVGVKTDSVIKAWGVVEITTFRTEEKYTDRRHPDQVVFAKTLKEDLGRRDFTINALALDYEFRVVDPFGGQSDLENKIIKAVGDPDHRFNEDALRLMRTVRLASQLGFEIDEETFQALKKNSGLIRFVSQERIRDEFMKIITSARPSLGVELLRETGILDLIIPELVEGYGIGQNKHHIYTVWEHNLRAMEYGAQEKFSVITILAALFHDIGKPRTKNGRGANCTFYGHDVVGAKIGARVMERLKFSKVEIEKVYKLIRWHLFSYTLKEDILGSDMGSEDTEYDRGVGETTDAAIRRLIRNVGEDNIEDLIKVRICDRIGSGVPKAVPYRLRHFQFRVEKILREKEAISVKMLKVKGEEVMKILGIPPSPRVG